VRASSSKARTGPARPPNRWELGTIRPSQAPLCGRALQKRKGCGARAPSQGRNESRRTPFCASSSEAANSISRRYLILAFSSASPSAKCRLFCRQKSSDVSLRPDHASVESTRVTLRHRHTMSRAVEVQRSLPGWALPPGKRRLFEFSRFAGPRQAMVSPLFVRAAAATGGACSSHRAQAPLCGGSSQNPPLGRYPGRDCTRYFLPKSDTISTEILRKPSLGLVCG
jgi:hypothetical protein